METVELQVDEETWNRAQSMAAARQCTVEDLIRDLIEQLSAASPPEDPLLGMMADEPALIDQVIASTLQARSEHPLR